MRDLVGLRHFRAHRFERLAGVVVAAKDQAESFLDALDRGRCEAGPLETDDVNPANLRRVAIGDHKRGHVLHDLGTAASDREPPDPTELMDRGQAAHDRAVADLDVAGEGAVVRENDAVADEAIVPDMAVGEKISTAADAGFAIALGAPVDRAELAKNVRLAELEIGRFPGVFQILRLLPDGAVGVELVMRPRDHRALQGHVMLQPATFAEDDVRADDAVRPHHRARPERRARVDDRRRMDLRRVHLVSRKVNMSSPSETTASFTVHLQRALAMRLLRAFSSSV